MSTTTSIEWTRNADGTDGRTWNPVTGCSRTSPGCSRCYALTMAARLKAMGQPRYQSDGDPRRGSGPGFAVTLHPDLIDAPRRWAKPSTVFVNSMSDLFHEEMPAEFIEAVFQTMAETPRHTFQVLTKRHERLAEVALTLPWPANVWMGVSIENRRFVHRADYLRRVPAAVRFISAEPLLGPLEGLDLDGIDWLIAGGESGHRARPCREEWLRDLRDRCQEAGVAYFLKQLGSVLAGGRGKGGGEAAVLDGRRWLETPGSLAA